MKTTLEKIAAPCSYLDLETFQSWLEDLSKQGYLLCKPGMMRNTYLFYHISPLDTRYRLTPVSDAFEDWNAQPDSRNQFLSEAFGWEYVCSVGCFHIYRTYDAESREMHSDPFVLAESLRLLRRKATICTFALFLSPLLYFLMIAFLVGPDHFWQHLIQNGITLYLSFALLFLFTTFKGAYHIAKLLKLYLYLNKGQLPIHYRDWRQSRKRFQASTTFTYAIGTMLILSIFFLRTSKQDSLRVHPHPDHSNTLPFVTVLDLANYSNAETANRLEVGGMIRWTNVLSATNYQWTEIVDVVSADGLEGRFGIELSYYTPNSLWLADFLTNELTEEAISTGTPAEQNISLDTDWAYFYTDHRGCPAAIVQNGCTVIRICFVRADFADTNLNLNIWVQRTMKAK